jgi:hypothetical protein
MKNGLIDVRFLFASGLPSSEIFVQPVILLAAAPSQPRRERVTLHAQANEWPSARHAVGRTVGKLRGPADLRG